jgi:hypothetical protein
LIGVNTSRGSVGVRSRLGEVELESAPFGWAPFPSPSTPAHSITRPATATSGAAPEKGPQGVDSSLPAVRAGNAPHRLIPEVRARPSGQFLEVPPIPTTNIDFSFFQTES